MAEQRVTDEQLTEWEDDAEVYGGEWPTARRVLALIEDLRVSRAREAEAAAVAVRAVELMNEAGAERDGLQQRIDKAMAMCAAADTDQEPRIMFVQLLDPRAVRAALTGTDTDHD